MSRMFAALTVVVCFASLLIGCAGIPESAFITSDETLVPPLEGTYTTSGGWGVVTLWETSDGFAGTYTDTWQSENGDLTLWMEDGRWIGTWEEPAIDRGGELYSIAISDGGATITGLANVVRQGGHSPFEDSPFTWIRE